MISFSVQPAIPIHFKLAALLEQTPRISDRILTSNWKRPYKDTTTLNHAVGYVLDRIKAKGYTQHGLRKNAGNALAEAAQRELAAVLFGERPCTCDAAGVAPVRPLVHREGRTAAYGDLAAGAGERRHGETEASKIQRSTINRVNGVGRERARRTGAQSAGSHRRPREATRIRTRALRYHATASRLPSSPTQQAEIPGFTR